MLTPEGLQLEYVLAGLGSRFIASLLDLMVRIAVFVALALALSLLHLQSARVVIGIIVSFALLYVYDVAFEVWGGGRTPGKRWSGLRVIRSSGSPINLAASAVRNLLRILDVYVSLGAVGIVSIVTTRRGQRLGDLAGATLVIRERRAADRGATRRRWRWPLARRGRAEEIWTEPPPGYTAGRADRLDVTAITPEDLAVIRDFLARRNELTQTARERVAHTLSAQMSGKVGGLDGHGVPPERLLERIAAAKAAPR